MTTRGTTKRKRLADEGEQGLSKSNSRKQAKGRLVAATAHSGNSKGRKKKAVGNGDEENEGEGAEDENCDDEDGNDSGDDEYDDNRSQKERMMLFEKKLIAMKKQKKPLSDSAIKFKKKVELREEIFINSLQEQRAKIKSNANAFSETLTSLLHDASKCSFSGSLIGSVIDPPDLVQRHQLHVPQVSITAVSTRLLASAQSLQDTLTIIADRELILGEGWEQDGDLSINALRQAKQAALLKLTEMISQDGEEDIGEMAWKRTVKISEKGIKRLLKNLPVAATDVGE